MSTVVECRSDGSSDTSSESEDDHFMLFAITDVDADASCESLADQRSAPTNTPLSRADSEEEPVRPLITLRERRLLKVR